MAPPSPSPVGGSAQGRWAHTRGTGPIERDRKPRSPSFWAEEGMPAAVLPGGGPLPTQRMFTVRPNRGAHRISSLWRFFSVVVRRSMNAKVP